VRLEFVGYDRDGVPAYVFTYGRPREADPIPIHDHQDNFNGGFAFSCYHPGTALPQQPTFAAGRRLRAHQRAHR
jgi:hypothetical protein